ncbi:dnaJ subfamily C member 21-like [Tripterygium wilfordii]|uniref:DnaJ subfamily C member 21-like n=1 Tax=Tripterygium wilfordii TaxID=458696 RepID=A0A7J7D3N5_TRIWF|nr:dnaJ subfamily C member 21-like [Tripterygium wilfordii]
MRYRGGIFWLGDSVAVPPAIGCMDSPIGQVRRFYDHWLGFSTVMKLGFDDEKMESKSRKEYNKSVRKLALALMVKQQDNRVIDMMEWRRKKGVLMAFYL